jgi:hypothetical protein
VRVVGVQTHIENVLETSRLAKMESGDPSVSLDLLFRSLFSLGITRKNLASTLSSGEGIEPPPAPDPSWADPLSGAQFFALIGE